MVHPSWPESKEIDCDGALFKLFASVVKSNLGKKVIKIIKVKHNKKVYKVLLEGGGIIRIDYKQGGLKKVSSIQMLAYNNGVKVPKVLDAGKIKLSEWINGTELYFVKNLLEVNIQLGELLGKLNTVKNNDKHIAMGDINNTNFIWTKDEELYLIDFGSLCLLDYGETMQKTAAGVSKRIVKSRRKWFYGGYAKYHDIDQFIKLVSKFDKFFQSGKKNYLIEG